MRSDVAKKGIPAAPNRSLFYALGYTKEELERPLIGVVSAHSEIVPGHAHLDKIADAVKANGEEAIVLADDSGLEIDALNKEPGVYSARYMGEDTSYRIKNANLIERLEGVPVEKRTARFVCAIAAVLTDGTVYTVRETIEGYIGYEERGENGFGYDPIFMVPEFNCTTAELTMEQKNKISHRGKALAKMKEELLQKGLIG